MEELVSLEVMLYEGVYHVLLRMLEPQNIERCSHIQRYLRLGNAQFILLLIGQSPSCLSLPVSLSLPTSVCVLGVGG